MPGKPATDRARGSENSLHPGGVRGAAGRILGPSMRRCDRVLASRDVGAWGPGPFDNDAAADFLQEAAGSIARAVVRALRAIVRAPAGREIDVDDGGAGWAACELIAIAYGHPATGDLDGGILDAASRLKPKEEHRLLAIEALPRIADPATSEIAGLSHEGNDGSGAVFDAAIAGLKARLAAAAAGRREVPRARKGDIYAIPTAPGATDVFVVQMVGPREAAVFSGIFPDDAAALAAVPDCLARRVSTDVHKLPGRGRLLANRPLRKDLRGIKLYASETGDLEHYALSRATGGGLSIVSYEKARQYDLLWGHSQKAMLAVARGKQPIARVRSTDEREAELRAWHGKEWEACRKATTPGPFGDVEELTKTLDWIDEYGIKNWIEVSHRIASGTQGGRKDRKDYAFAALVAIWRGTLPRKLWPDELKPRLPPPPGKAALATALRAARVLVGKILALDSELRQIWDSGPDRGAELRKWVARLQRALA